MESGGRSVVRVLVAAVVRRGHPASIDGTISLDALGAHPHLIISSTAENTDFLDKELDFERNDTLPSL